MLLRIYIFVKSGEAISVCTCEYHRFALRYSLRLDRPVKFRFNYFFISTANIKKLVLIPIPNTPDPPYVLILVSFLFNVIFGQALTIFFLHSGSMLR